MKQAIRKWRMTLVMALVLAVILMPHLAVPADAAEPATARFDNLRVEMNSGRCQNPSHDHAYNKLLFPITDLTITGIGTRSEQRDQTTYNYVCISISYTLTCDENVTSTFTDVLEGPLEGFCTKAYDGRYGCIFDGEPHNSARNHGFIYKPATHVNASFTSLENGRHTVNCPVCDTVEEDCTYSNFTHVDENTHQGTCTSCSYQQNFAHTGGTATCTTPATCNACFSLYGPLNPNNHSWGNWVFNGTNTHRHTCKYDPTHFEDAPCSGTQPTCTKDGICSECTGHYIPKLNHSLQYTITDGNRAVETCKNGCGHEAKAQLTVWNGPYTGYPVHNAKLETDQDWLGPTEINYGPWVDAGSTYAKVHLAAAVYMEAEYQITPVDLASLAPEGGFVSSEPFNNNIHRPVRIEYKGWVVNESKGVGAYSIGDWSGQPFYPGTYRTTITGSQNFSGSVTWTHTVTNAKLKDISILQTNTLVYDGTEQIPEVAASAATDVPGYSDSIQITYGKTPDGPFTATVPGVTEGGTHTYYGKFSCSFHDTEIVPFTVTVQRKAIEVPAISGTVYNGQLQTADIADTELYTVEANAGGVASGTYPVVLKLKNPQNYAWSGSESPEVTQYFVISPDHNEWTSEPGIADWTYGESPSVPNPGSAKYGTNTVLRYEGTTNAGGAYSSTAAPTEAGAYRAVFWQPAADNYLALEEKAVDFRVLRSQALTAEHFVFEAPADLTYNAASKTARVEAAPGLTGVGEVSVHYQPDSAIPVGTYTAIIDVAQGHNYEAVSGLTNPDWTFTIVPAKAPAIKLPTATVEYGRPLSMAECTDLTWHWVTPDFVPLTNGGAGAYQYVDDVNYDYNSVEGYDAGTSAVFRDIHVSVSKTTPVITLKASAEEAFHDTCLTFTAAAKNPNNDSFTDLPEPAFSYRIGDKGSWKAFSGTLNLAERAVTEGDVITVRAFTISEGWYHGAEATTTVTVVPKPMQAFTGKAISKVYGDGVFPIGETFREGTLTYTVEEGSNVVSIDELGNITILNAGTAVISVTAAETAGYAESTGTVTVTVQPRSITAAPKSVSVMPYQKAPAPEIVYTGLVGEDTVEAKPYDLRLFDRNGAEITLENAAKISGTYTIRWINMEEISFAELTNYQVRKIETGKITVIAPEIPEEKFENITKDNVALEDKDGLKAAKADLEEALKPENKGSYTSEEQKKLQEDLDRINGALKAIEQVEDMSASIGRLPESVPTDTDEKTESEILAVKAAYEKLTDQQKSQIDKKDRTKLENLVQTLTDYKIIKGNRTRWVRGSGNNLKFTANGPDRKFKELKIDGQVVSSRYYTHKNGSTIITLKSSYLKTLSTGTHTIQVVFTDGATSGNDYFQIYVNGRNPFTGDENGTMLLTASVTLVCTLCAAMALMFIPRKKNKFRR